jgi:hypothetical protein
MEILCYFMTVSYFAGYGIQIYADDLNLLGDNVDTSEKSVEASIDASRKVGVGVNTEITRYMLLSRLQNAGQD